jgi:hypothetical protein
MGQLRGSPLHGSFSPNLPGGKTLQPEWISGFIDDLSCYQVIVVKTEKVSFFDFLARFIIGAFVDRPCGLSAAV